jgi:hypothetical protein
MLASFPVSKLQIDRKFNANNSHVFYYFSTFLRQKCPYLSGNNGGTPSGRGFRPPAENQGKGPARGGTDG